MSGESVPVTLPTVFTIGHSTRALDTFIQMLRTHGVTHLVDVRTIPRSRHNPQFNRDTVPEALRLAGIAYTHMEQLANAGIRGRSGEAHSTRGMRASRIYVRRGSTLALSSVTDSGRTEGTWHAGPEYHGRRPDTAALAYSLRKGLGHPYHLSSRDKVTSGNAALNQLDRFSAWSPHLGLRTKQGV